MVLALAGPTPMLIRGDPFAVVGDQMPGRHLMLLPRQIGNGLFRRFGLGGDPDPAGAGESDIGAVGIEDLAAAPADELIHVAGIVGEQHVGLEVFRRRAGVVTQTRQRKSTRRASKCDSG